MGGEREDDVPRSVGGREEEAGWSTGSGTEQEGEEEEGGGGAGEERG